MKRAALAVTLILWLFSVMVTVQPVKAQFLNVHIKNDGSIVGTEGTNDIQRIGDTYILKNSINGSIFVEKDNVTIDGAGYSLQGNGSGIGISLGLKTEGIGYGGITIKNLQIKGFWWGIHLEKSYNNSITDNYLVDNKDMGISIKSTSATTISGNTIKNNYYGIYLEGYSQRIYHNNFINNAVHVDSPLWFPYIVRPLPYGTFIWDNGYPSGGNYWSDYNGNDTNHDGIGDTPYMVSQYRNNTDHYPLMEPVDVIPEFPSGIILPLLIIVLISVGLVVYFKKRKG
jgi:parallel beta-helix repeat protein